jgi:hypothetical protein
LAQGEHMYRAAATPPPQLVVIHPAQPLAHFFPIE